MGTQRLRFAFSTYRNGLRRNGSDYAQAHQDPHAHRPADGLYRRDRPGRPFLSREPLRRAGLGLRALAGASRQSPHCCARADEALVLARPPAAPPFGIGLVEIRIR